MPEAEKNGKTTLWGIVGAIGAILVGVAAGMDGDPETIMDTQALTGAIGALLAALGIGVGGLKSKDK